MSKNALALLKRHRSLPFGNLTKRLTELEALKRSTNSKTSQELLTKGTAFSKWAIKSYLQLGQTVIALLEFRIAETGSVERELDNLSPAFEEFKSAALGAISDEHISVKEAEEWATNVVNFQQAISNYISARRDLTFISVETALEAMVDLAAELFEDIARPDHSQFHSEAAKELLMSAVKKIDIFSLWDDVETLKRMVPIARMTEYISDGDKVLFYVEAYNETVLEWIFIAKLLTERLVRDMHAPPPPHPP
jgi:hypothetical protein